MPFNGNGLYALPSTTVTPAVTDTTIASADFNTFNADLATSLTLCVTKDGQTTSPTLTTPIINEIHDANGNELIDFGPTVSAVNNIKINNATTTNRPTIATAGETDIGLNFTTSEAEEMLVLSATASAVNEVTITSAATANAPTMAATGSDTNIDLQLAGKGTGGVYGTLKAGSVQATTSGTEAEFTSIPSWVKKITIGCAGVSTASTGFVAIEVGDSGGYETTGYSSMVNEFRSTGPVITGTFDTTAFVMTNNITASVAIHGIATLVLIDSSTNTWAYSSSMYEDTNFYTKLAAGSKSLSGTLDRLKVITDATFDAGKVNILYEG